MPRIIQLSPHIANLIAAGEVVERPASVVKELLENAVDAGASKVTIEIRDGGMTFLRVTDNGCGMLPEDAGPPFCATPPPSCAPLKIWLPSAPWASGAKLWRPSLPSAASIC